MDPQSTIQLKVFILTTQDEVIQDTLEDLPRDMTLEELRKALTNSPLGEPERDIFYPPWTCSVFMMVSQNNPIPDDFRKPDHLVKNDEELKQLFENCSQNQQEEVVLLLQQTRAKRYKNKSKTIAWKEQPRSAWMETGGYDSIIPAMACYYPHPGNPISYYPVPVHHNQMFQSYPFHPSAQVNMMNMNTTYYNNGTPVQFGYNM